MNLSMLTNIHVELIHTFNPLYAVPIVAVVFCAFLVYAFGFKSPAPPPSFDNERKYSKKRKNKEIQKQSKSIINGKANGKISEITKKKNSSSMTVNEKTLKKVQRQSDKKVPQEKRKDSLPYEDLNDDGWVQHISKKGRKNRKKEDNSIPYAQSKTTQIIEPLELIKSEISSVIEETKPVPIEKPTIHNSITEKEMQPNDKGIKKMNKKNLIFSSNSEKLPTIVKSGDEDVEKILKTVTKNSAEDIKYKNKKNHIPPSSQNENNKAVKEVDSIFVALDERAIKNNTATNTSDSKSNVAFDELAGLYPETKEKKKKKVRRDH